MRTENIYDAIIAGAGPAGMMLAADLAPGRSVLVLEKGRAGTTTRSWYTFMDRIEADGLEKAVVARPRRLEFYMGPRAYFTHTDRHALIDETKALEIFKSRAEAAGAVFRSNTAVLGASTERGSVTVRTNRGEYSGRLLIDCMGTRSPIVLEHKLQKNMAIWTIFGARLAGLRAGKFFDPDTIGFYKIPDDLQPAGDDSNYMMGIYPKGGDRGDAYIFHFDTEHRDPEYLAPLFRATCREWFPRARETAPLKGWIYEGELSRYALPRIIFIGDSGALTPPAIGMGFNANLRTHKETARRIAEALDADALDAASLENILADRRASSLRAFQRIVQRYFLYGDTIRHYTEGIGILKAGGADFTRAWMRNELTPALIARGMTAIMKTVGFKKMFSLVPKREYLAFVEDIVQVAERAAFEVAHKEFHRDLNTTTCALCARSAHS